MQNCIGVKNELDDWMQDERGCVGVDGGESRPNEIINRRKFSSHFDLIAFGGGRWMARAMGSLSSFGALG